MTQIEILPAYTNTIIHYKDGNKKGEVFFEVFGVALGEEGMHKEIMKNKKAKTISDLKTCKKIIEL